MRNVLERWWELIRGAPPRHSRPLVDEGGRTPRLRNRWWYDASYPISLTPEEARKRFDRYDVSVRPDGSFSYGRAFQIVGRVESGTEHTTFVRAKVGRSAGSWVVLILAASALMWLAINVALAPFTGTDGVVFSALLIGLLTIQVFRAGANPFAETPDDVVEQFRQILRPQHRRRSVVPAYADRDVPPWSIGQVWSCLGTALRRPRAVRVISPLDVDEAKTSLLEAFGKRRAWRWSPTERISPVGPSGPSSGKVWGRVKPRPTGSRLHLRCGVRPIDRAIHLIALAFVLGAGLICVAGSVFGEGVGATGMLLGVVLLFIGAGILGEMAQNEADRRRGPDILQMVIDAVHGSIDRSR